MAPALPSQRLRVLFLASRDWYHPATTGGDITLWENARYLASVGHEVTFVAARYAGAPQEELLDGIKVVRLGGLHSLWLRTFTYYLSRGRGRYDVVVAEGFGGSRIPRLTPCFYCRRSLETIPSRQSLWGASSAMLKWLASFSSGRLKTTAALATREPS